MESIRQISAPFEGNFIALAEFEKRVAVLDINKKQIVNEFSTILDFGGKRLAIDSTGQICVCGNYGRQGVCAYEVTTGKKIWQRKDLTTVQKIQLLRSKPGTIFLQFENRDSRFLNILTGEDGTLLKGIDFVFESKFQPLNAIGKGARIEVTDRNSSRVNAIIEKESFEILDISFSADSILISESNGPLRCFGTTSGNLLWQNPMDSDGHFLNVAYNEKLDRFLGVSWQFLKGGVKKLKYIVPKDGKIDREIILDKPAETEFALDGALLITSDRKMINTTTGETESWN